MRRLNAEFAENSWAFLLLGWVSGAAYEPGTPTSPTESFSDFRFWRWVRPVPSLLFFEKRRAEATRPWRVVLHGSGGDSRVSDRRRCCRDDFGPARRVHHLDYCARRRGAAG